jgi:hypothetical protein
MLRIDLILDVMIISLHRMEWMVKMMIQLINDKVFISFFFIDRWRSVHN